MQNCGSLMIKKHYNFWPSATTDVNCWIVTFNISGCGWSRIHRIPDSAWRCLRGTSEELDPGFFAETTSRKIQNSMPAWPCTITENNCDYSTISRWWLRMVKNCYVFPIRFINLAGKNPKNLRFTSYLHKIPGAFSTPETLKIRPAHLISSAWGLMIPTKRHRCTHVRRKDIWRI